MQGVLIVVLVVAVVAGSVVLARRVRHPENTASHHDEGRGSTGERFYSDTDHPAGPDAEDPIGPTRADG
ncbi:MAG TPA: hypothetical protein VFU19_08970 [Iamia sp.]|nr:hypothetical protein [Iamia sp.]